MSVVRTFAILAVATSLSVTAARAQNAPTDYRDEALRHFAQSSDKVVQLARAMPGELYSWRPMEGVMPVAQVYMHIARYNYLYLTNELGLPLPPHIDMDTMEEVTTKAKVTAMLEESVEFVKHHVSAMSESDVTAMTVQYGRDVAGWSVLFQLVAHMNEHVGQSIAYARMNKVVPPWSR